MHTQETKNEFIQLRANGLSFDTIAEKLNVSKSTLIRWGRDHDAEIRSLRAVELDALYDSIFLARQVTADSLAALQTKIEYELLHRDIRLLETTDLFKAASLIRKEIRHLRKDTLQPLQPNRNSPVAVPFIETAAPEPPPTAEPAQ